MVEESAWSMIAPSLLKGVLTSVYHTEAESGAGKKAVQRVRTALQSFASLTEVAKGVVFLAVTKVRRVQPTNVKLTVVEDVVSGRDVRSQHKALVFAKRTEVENAALLSGAQNLLEENPISAVV